MSEDATAIAAFTESDKDAERAAIVAKYDRVCSEIARETLEIDFFSLLGPRRGSGHRSLGGSEFRRLSFDRSPRVFTVRKRHRRASSLVYSFSSKKHLAEVRYSEKYLQHERERQMKWNKMLSKWEKYRDSEKVRLSVILPVSRAFL